MSVVLLLVLLGLDVEDVLDGAVLIELEVLVSELDEVLLLGVVEVELDGDVL